MREMPFSIISSMANFKPTGPTGPTPVTWVAVGHAGGGGNTIATSVDGNTWAGLGQTIFTSYGLGVAYGKDVLNNNLWVAVGSGGGVNTIATSTNGTSWTGLGSTVITSIGLGVASNA